MKSQMLTVGANGASRNLNSNQLKRCIDAILKRRVITIHHYCFRHFYPLIYPLAYPKIHIYGEVPSCSNKLQNFLFYPS